MSTTPNRGYPIPDPADAIHPGVRDLAMAIDADIAAGGGGGGGDVTSVFGRTGIVVAVSGDYTWAQIDKTVSSLADITTRSAGDLSSGTLPDARFPATLPVISGANLTSLNAASLASGTIPAARMPALTGDVTTTVGTVSTTIANNAVSLAKLADIATASFLGRNTAGTGDPEVLSVATAKTMLGLSGSNTGDVTLAGQNYLTIAGQVITANPIDLSGTHVTGTLTANKGGTGRASYAVGDLLYASGATALSKLADVATGNALISGGIGVAPGWGKIGLTTHISGTLAVGNGGTGATSFTANGVLYGNTTGAVQVTAQGGANTVLVASAGAPSFSAAPVIGTSITVPLITTLASGNLSINPTGSVVFDATGNQIDPLTNYDQNLGQLSKKYLTLHAAELWVETLVAQNTIATIGGRILIGPTTVLTSDLPAANTSIIVKHNQIVSGDRVYLESNGKVEFLAITSGPSGSGPYTYTVTRNLDGTGANDWFAGDAVFNTGQTGNGFIDLYSVRGVKSASQAGPTIVGNVRNSATYNDWSERWAIGNLNGLYGYGTDIYGVAMGVPSGAWVKIDPTNGVRIGHNTTTLTQIDAAGNASFTGSITSSSGLIGGFSIGATSLIAGTGPLAVGIDSGGVNPAIYAGNEETFYTSGASAFYQLDEASGTRADFIGSNDLTDNNTVTQAAGKVGNAALFTAANSEWLSRASVSALQAGNISFTITAWVYLVSKAGVLRVIVSKDGSGAGNREYLLSYVTLADTFRFDVFKATDSVVSVSSTSFGSPSLNTWYFVAAWHDATNDTINIQVNNGVIDSIATGGSLQVAGAADFGVGGRATIGSLQPFDGRIDGVGYWKRLLTTEERTQSFTLQNPGSAPFRVTNAGALTATNATITGVVTATSGTIGGWTIGATSLVSGSGATTVAMDSGGTNPAFYAGSATPGSAPFRVSNTGALVAINATITGASGNVVLDSSGMVLTSGVDTTNKITWKSGGNIGGQIYQDFGVSDDFIAVVGLSQTAGKTAKASLFAMNQTGASYDIAFDVTSEGATFGTGAKVYANLFGVNAWNDGNMKGLQIGAFGEPRAMLEVITRNPSTSAIYDAAVLNAAVGGAASANFGVGLRYLLETSTTESQDAARISAIWTTATHASRTSAVTIQTVNNAGALTEVARIGQGLQMGTPTGGDKGAGTINVAGDIYKNNTAYTNPDYVLERWATGTISRFADKPGALNYPGTMDLGELRRFMQTNFHLPRFGQQVSHGLFSGGDAVLASLEESYIYILQLEERINRLETTKWNLES